MPARQRPAARSSRIFRPISSCDVVPITLSLRAVKRIRTPCIRTPAQGSSRRMPASGPRRGLRLR
jgi:hypothetical protein